MSGDSPLEVLDEAEHVRERRPLAHLREKVAGQLPDLYVLEPELALGIATRKGRAGERGKENAFLRGGPAGELRVEVRQGEPAGVVLPAVERAAKIVEAAPKPLLNGEKLVLGIHATNRPDPVRSA